MNLRILYIERKIVLKEISLAEKIKKKEINGIYIGFQNQDINWYIRLLKNKLKENYKLIRKTRSKLIEL